MGSLRRRSRTSGQRGRADAEELLEHEATAAVRTGRAGVLGRVARPEACRWGKRQLKCMLTWCLFFGAFLGRRHHGAWLSGGAVGGLDC